MLSLRLACALALCSACADRDVRWPLAVSTSPPLDYDVSDDGAHPSTAPDYFEWWYYDAIFDDGSSATVALYAATTGERHGKPGVLVNVLDAAGTSYEAYTAFTTRELATNSSGDVHVGPSRAVHDGDRLQLHAVGVTTDGTPLTVDLSLQPQMAGFKVGDGAVRDDGRVILGWTVPMPRAAVTGTVRIGTHEAHVHGMGYHDHNWGELNLADTMAYWYWGRITSSDLSVIYAELHLQPSYATAPIGFVLVGDAVHLTQGFLGASFTPQGSHFVKGANREAPQGLRIEHPRFTLALAERSLVQAVDFSERLPAWERPLVHLVSHPAYVRTLCDYTFTSGLADVPARSSGVALVEYMYVHAL